MVDRPIFAISHPLDHENSMSVVGVICFSRCLLLAKFVTSLVLWDAAMLTVDLEDTEYGCTGVPRNTVPNG